MINCIVSENSITLCWEKTNGSVYNAVIDGKAFSTNRTHYTFKNLKPDCRYTVAVMDESGNDVIAERCIKTDSPKNKINICDSPFNAVGDGRTLNTAAIQAAIDSVCKGECLYIPEGVFLTGALKLHSDMMLYIEKGAVLRGTEYPKDYLPKIPSRFEGIERECYSSLLNLGELDRSGNITCENVTITGGGTIDGGGRRLAENIIELESELMKDYIDSLGDKIADYEFPKTIPGRARPRLINISNCRNIVLSGITVKNAPSWMVHMVYSRDIVTFGCEFYSHDVWNGDGWDPDSSENCSIFDCTFNTGDDCIAIKSGKNPEGNIINKPCSSINIFDCRCVMGHGITIGSEMSGGVEDINIWDCDMEKSTVGVELKATKKRGGYIKDVHISGCVLPRVMMHSVSYNDDGIAAGACPYFENISVDNTVLTGDAHINDGTREKCPIIEIEGFTAEKDTIRNIKFKNITDASGSGKITVKDAANVVLEDFRSK